MKLNKLTIKNIASISEAVIDFGAPPLSDAPIFLICGETGSGKSTILDAICLALYNKTPRLANSRSTSENCYREGNQEISIVSVNQLLKKGETYGEITLSFQGADSSEYIAEWSCRINRNHRLEDEKWSISDSKGNTDSSKGAERYAKMTEIIGLDYDQFCRTSMLAQGQFTQFLKADSKEKSNILEKITGTEIYSRIGDRIHRHTKEASDSVKTAEKDLSNISSRPVEEVEKARKEIVIIDESLDKYKDELTTLEKLIKAYENIESTKESIRNAEQTINSAAMMFEQLNNDFEYKGVIVNDKKKQLAELSSKLEQKKGDATMFENEKVISNLLQTAEEQRKHKLEHRQNLEKALENGKQLTASLSVLEEALKKSENVLSEKKKAASAALDAKNALEPEKVEKQRQNIDKLFRRINEAVGEYASINADKERICEEEKEQKKLQEEIIQDRKGLALLSEKKNDAETEYNECEKIYELHSRALDQAAISLRNWMREHEVTECPVCHSRLESIMSEEDVNDILKPYRQELEEKEKRKQQACNALTAAATAVGIKENSWNKSESRIAKEKSSINKKIEDYALKYSILGVSGREDNTVAILQGKKSELETKKIKNDELIGLIAGKQKAVDAANKQVSDYQDDIYTPLLTDYTDNEKKLIKAKADAENASKLMKAAENTESESIVKAGKLISFPEWKDAWERDAVDFLSKLSSEAQTYREERDSFDALTNEVSVLETFINEIGDLRRNILAANPEFATETIAPQAFMGNAVYEWGAIGNIAVSARENIRKGNEAIALNMALLEQAFEADSKLPKTKEELLERKEAVNADMLSISDRRGELRRILLEEDEKLEKTKEKELLLEDAKRIETRWKTLDGIFGGADGFLFKKIAQSYIMQDILNHANSYLRRIAPRYELTAKPGSLIILVKDNEDGICRSGNTLSGGEGFVISLSLALGLSSLSESNICVDTIFIDEGFGTLSQEWLNAVMATLEKLNSVSGKHVGIISHIEDLQNRIPAVIEVKKVNATSSIAVCRTRIGRQDLPK